MIRFRRFVDQTSGGNVLISRRLFSPLREDPENKGDHNAALPPLFRRYPTYQHNEEKQQGYKHPGLPLVSIALRHVFQPLPSRILSARQNIPFPSSKR
jgi:hypothetical protein